MKLKVLNSKKDGYIAFKSSIEIYKKILML